MANYQIIGSKVRVDIDGAFIGAYATMTAAERAVRAYQGETP